MPKEDHWFKPGQSGNPKGRKPLPPGEKGLAGLTKNKVRQLFGKFMGLTTQEIIAKCEDKTTPALEMILGRIILKAISTGDYTRLEFLLNRVVGKVKDEIDHTTREHFTITYADGSKEILGTNEGEDD